MDRDLAAYHGVEHKAIAAYEQGIDDPAGVPKEHERCGSNLIVPMMLLSAGGTVLLERWSRGPGPRRAPAVGLGGASIAVEMFAWSDRHHGGPLAEAFHLPAARSSAGWRPRSRPRSSSRSASRRWRRSSGSSRRGRRGPAAARGIDLPPCLAASITSGSRSRTSTPPWPSTREASRWRRPPRDGRVPGRRGGPARRRRRPRRAAGAARPRHPGRQVHGQERPGLHHVAYAVDDIEAVLERIAAAGVELIDTKPRVGIRDSRVAFLHPRSTGGVLTEIVEPAGGH